MKQEKSALNKRLVCLHGRVDSLLTFFRPTQRKSDRSRSTRTRKFANALLKIPNVSNVSLPI